MAKRFLMTFAAFTLATGLGGAILARQDGGDNLDRLVELLPREPAARRRLIELLEADTAARVKATDKYRRMFATLRYRVLTAAAPNHVPFFAAVEDALPTRLSANIEALATLRRKSLGYIRNEAAYQGAGKFVEGQKEMELEISRLQEAWSDIWPVLKKYAELKRTIRPGAGADTPKDAGAERIDEDVFFALGLALAEADRDFVPLRRAEMDALKRFGRVFALLDREVPLAAAHRDVKGLIDEIAYADAEGKKLLTLVNRYRMMLGLAPFRPDEKLSAAAGGHSADMAQHGFFSHFSPLDGKRLPRQRVELAGFAHDGCAENIHMHTHNDVHSERAFAGWFASPGHHRTMVGGEHDCIGVGYARDVRGNTYWTIVTAKKRR